MSNWIDDFGSGDPDGGVARSARRQPRSAASPRATLATPALSLAVALCLALVLALAARAEAFVYWTEVPSGSGSWGIARANPEGTGVNPDFLPTPPVIGCCQYEGATGVAVDDSHVYWAGHSGGIGRANLDGTGARQRFIPPSPSGGDPLAGIGAYLCDLAVDAGHLYWSEEDTNDPNSVTITRANLDGTGVKRNFITGGVACTVEVDDAHVYWTSRHEGAGTIARANLDGTGVDHGFLTPRGGVCGVAVGASHLYWIGSGGIGRANLDGTGADPRFIPDAYGCDLTVDAGHIYWANGYAIGRASLDGTGADASFIADAGEFAYDVAVDPLRSFGFGRVKSNKRKGTAKLTVNVPAAGSLRLAKTKVVKGASELDAAAGKLTLSIRPRGKAKEKLERTGTAKKKRKRTRRVKVKAKVTYTPLGSGDPNIVASTDAQVVTLVKRG